MAVLAIGGVNDRSVPRFDPVTARALRMIQRKRPNGRATKSYGLPSHGHKFLVIGNRVKWNGKVGANHLIGKRFAQRTRVAGGVERGLAHRVVKRPEKRKSLNVIPMKMREEDMEVFGRILI